MKFTISKSVLNGYLQSVLLVSPSKPALPILSNLMIEALDGKLKISATDLDISITATVDCSVSRKGTVAAPARILHEIIRELPESDIDFELNGSRLEIKVPNGFYKISTVSVEDYPTLPAINLKKQIKVSGKDIVQMIHRVTFACSTDETRPALNGTLWQTKGDKMVMVATDGHRLSRVEVMNSKLKGMHEDIIVPPKALNLIAKFAGESESEIGIIFGESNLSFNVGDIVLTTRLIEGPYPNYEQVIPQNNSAKLRVNRIELAGAVRRVAILSSSLTQQVRFAIKGSKLQLSSANTDVGGEAQETISCDYQGEALELGYKASYVQDVLEKIEQDDVIFDLESSIAAGVIYGAETNKNEFLCLIMPLRLAE